MQTIEQVENFFKNLEGFTIYPKTAQANSGSFVRYIMDYEHFTYGSVSSNGEIKLAVSPPTIGTKPFVETISIAARNYDSLRRKLDGGSLVYSPDSLFEQTLIDAGHQMTSLRAHDNARGLSAFVTNA